MRAILASALALTACAHAPRAPRYRNLELRLVAESGGTAFPGWSEPGTALLDSAVLFSGRDFESIDVSRGGDDGKTPSLALHFTPEAAARFADATTRATGRRLAAVVGGKIVAAPRILHPITTGLFEITGPSESDVREMVRLIAGGGTNGGAMAGSNYTFFIEGRPVGQAEFDARLKALNPVENTWFCAETDVGGDTGYDGKDADGVVYEYRQTVAGDSNVSTLTKKRAP